MGCFPISRSVSTSRWPRRSSAFPDGNSPKSRVSILTGLSRKRGAAGAAHPRPGGPGRRRAAQPGSARDRRLGPEARGFRDDTGNLAELSFAGGASSFGNLVKTYSGDSPARAVLDELLRVGAVQRMPNGKVRLLERSYIPKTGEIDKIGILGVDASALIATIDHNIRQPDAPFFQRKVCYDNLPMEALPELKKKAAARGQSLLESLDRWMSARDRDVTPGVPGTGRKRAGIGIYYFQENYREGGEA